MQNRSIALVLAVLVVVGLPLIVWSLRRDHAQVRSDPRVPAPGASPQVQLVDFALLRKELGLQTPGTYGDLDDERRNRVNALLDGSWGFDYGPYSESSLADVMPSVLALEAAYRDQDYRALRAWADAWRLSKPSSSPDSVTSTPITGTGLTTRDVAEAAYSIVGSLLSDISSRGPFAKHPDAVDQTTAVFDSLVVYLVEDLAALDKSGPVLAMGFNSPIASGLLLDPDAATRSGMLPVAVVLRDFRPAVPGLNVAYYGPRERLILSLFIHQPPPLREPTATRPVPQGRPTRHSGAEGYGGPNTSGGVDMEELLERQRRKDFLDTALDVAWVLPHSPSTIDQCRTSPDRRTYGRHRNSRTQLD